jgi:hypothetical protein
LLVHGRTACRGCFSVRRRRTRIRST